MRIGESMAAELAHEAQSARETLARVPTDRFDYRPHPKCMTMGALASHIAESMGWAAPTITLPELALDADMKPFAGATTDEVLAVFDTNLAAALEALRGVPDEALAETWTLKVGGATVLSMPRGAVLRSMVLSHLVHHRAQLGLYLRLNDLPVPSVYGPTADEGPAFAEDPEGALKTWEE